MGQEIWSKKKTGKDSSPKQDWILYLEKDVPYPHRGDMRCPGEDIHRRMFRQGSSQHILGWSWVKKRASLVRATGHHHMLLLPVSSGHLMSNSPWLTSTALASQQLSTCTILIANATHFYCRLLIITDKDGNVPLSRQQGQWYFIGQCRSCVCSNACNHSTAVCSETLNVTPAT